MKALVTGVDGQLGHDIANEPNKWSYECSGTDVRLIGGGVVGGAAVTTASYARLDITDREVVQRIEVQPKAVVRCVA